MLWVIEEIFTKKNFNTFLGKKFEKLVREKIIPQINIFQIQKIGRRWGYCRDPETKKRNEIEIDIVGINKDSNEILFGECKWKEDVDGNKLLKKLKEKSKYVEWPNKKKDRKEIFVIIAKSFKNKSSIKNVHYYDLKTIEKIVMSNTKVI